MSELVWKILRIPTENQLDGYDKMADFYFINHHPLLCRYLPDERLRTKSIHVPFNMPEAFV